MLQQAFDQGLKVIIKEGVANGRLTARNDSLNFEPKRKLLEQVATDLNTTIDGLALAAALNQPWAETVLSGAATCEHLQSNLAATKVQWNEQIAKQLASLVESPEEYWTSRSNLAWN